MGLDMYLNAERYFWSHGDENQKVAKAVAATSGVPDFAEVKTVSAEAMYWRKANAIHAWFVEHVQDGEDNCGDYEVSREQLKELAGVIDEILTARAQSGDDAAAKIAAEKLPPTPGFFFGSTEIDEGYWSDLQETKERFALLDKFPECQWYFKYHSSW